MSSFSGKFVLRLTPSLHETLADRALESGVSLNQATLDCISEGLKRRENEKKYLKHLPPLLVSLKKKFKKDLLGLVVFGSQVRGEATAASDIDLLIVLSDAVPLKRALYRRWEKNFSPHFVHLPKIVSDASGIWFEVATEGEVVYQKHRSLRQFLDRIIAAVQAGVLQREWSHGHPYWIRSHHLRLSQRDNAPLAHAQVVGRRENEK